MMGWAYIVEPTLLPLPADLCELTKPLLEKLGHSKGRIATLKLGEHYATQWMKQKRTMEKITSYLASCIFVEDAENLHDVGDDLLAGTFLSVLVNNEHFKLPEKALDLLRCLRMEYKDLFSQRRLPASDNVLDLTSESEVTTSAADNYRLKDKLTMCQQLNHALQSHYINYAEQNLSYLDTKNEIVTAVQVIKALPPTLYSNEEFRDAVKISGLAETIRLISSPAFHAQQRNPHSPKLDRYYRLGESLSLILHSWVPEAQRQAWNMEHLSDAPLCEAPLTALHEVKDPKTLFTVFKFNRHLVPTTSNPSSVHFLLNLENFLGAWNQWLSPSLIELKYKISRQILENPQNFYANICQYVRKRLASADFSHLGKNLECILKRTAEHWKERDSIKETLNSKQLSLDGCAFCSQLPIDQRCVQEIIMPHRFAPSSEETETQEQQTMRVAQCEEYRKTLRGSVVSMWEPEKVMKPRNTPMSPKNLVYHPNDPELRLQEIKSDTDIVHRCGRHIILLTESKGAKPHNFIYFHAFSKERYNHMKETHEKVTHIRPLRRRGEFATWDDGDSMFPIGSRIGMGGRAGDTYAAYAGIEGDNVDGINFLFDEALISQSLYLTAEYVCPDIAHTLRVASVNCDRMGMVGANLYHTTGYVAPLHSEEDMCTGLCIQLERIADDDHCEFAFCYPEYGYYIRTEDNCLWSFDSSYIHGTMLPCEETRKNLRVGSAHRLRGGNEPTMTSTGVHMVVTRADGNRANLNAEVRRTYNLRSKYFAST